MELERYFSGVIAVVLIDGSRLPAEVAADEMWEGERTIYRVSFQQGTEVKVAESEEGFFDALRRLRVQMEKTGRLLYCFGASENVYPSGMQKSMGPAIMAYRTQMGSPAASQDIVNVFEADETVSPSTVEEQERFHERWLSSLSSMRSG
jgi:hypothetical protein